MVDDTSPKRRAEAEHANGRLSSAQKRTPDAKDSATLTPPSTTANLTIPDVPDRSGARSPDALSVVSAEDYSEFRVYDDAARERAASPEPASSPVSESFEKQAPASATALALRRWRRAWHRNKGLVMVLLSQICAVAMGAATRVLEHEQSPGIPGLDPFQILFARMLVTLVACVLYMRYTQVEHAPLGHASVRALLVARGMGGFFGVYGLYYSIQYISLSDATVIGFLAPSLTNWICSKLIAQPFTRAEQLGGAVSLLGTVLVARPTFIFSALAHPAATPPEATNSSGGGATSAQRLSAIGMALLGVAGTAVAFTTIRWIGHRAHPLQSVTYFAAWCTLVSAAALACAPGIPFRLPATRAQWALLGLVGVVGFANQFLLTAGLRYEKSGRATNMTYASVVFAMLADYLLWRDVPSVLSLAGSALIVGSAVVVAVQRERGREGAVAGGIEMRAGEGRGGGGESEREREGLLNEDEEVGDERGDHA